MKTLVELPLLPLRDVVVYPHMVIPLFVERKTFPSRRQRDRRQANLLLAQKNPADDDPAKMACTAWVRSHRAAVAQAAGWHRQGAGRRRAARPGRALHREEGHIRAAVQAIDDANVGEREAEVFTRSLLSQFEQYVQLGKKVPAEVLSSLNSIDEPSRLVDTMAAHMALKIEQKQDILEIT
ncbi:LON peptidase substrate-binding domain-containing protein [Pseudomonas aeruginosa]|nr:LON peptidase substrate-binding domain-containing protein [Pseudomonas aeruginosa]